MALADLKTVLEGAESGGYGVGAFNCNNMEIIQAILSAAMQERAPVIIQASQGAIAYAGLEYIAALGKIAGRTTGVPVVLHLDHGTSFEQVVRCIRYGFTSVMVDGSKLPLQENIALTRRVLEVARAAGVSVEGELGTIGGTEDNISLSEKEALMTDPGEALRFCQETGVDALAVSIGTAHGRYKGVPRLDFDRLKRIRELVKTPIVLHGSSGVPDEAIRRAIELGVRKINIDTNIREAFMRGVKDGLARNPEEIDPRKILGLARENAAVLISEKIQLFGCAGKA